MPTRPTASNNNAKGFSFATNGSLYLKGNYIADGTLPANNADIVVPEADEPPASVAGDAVTILSNAWNDAASTQGLSNRRASQTEVGAAIIAGTVPTNKGNNDAWFYAMNGRFNRGREARKGKLSKPSGESPIAHAVVA